MRSLNPKQLKKSMKKRYKVILSLALVGLTAASAQALPKIEHWINNDGVPVYFVHTAEIPMLDINVILKAGAIHDGEQQGVAAITAQLLKHGTQNKDIEQLNDALSDLAIHCGTGASLETINLSLRSISDKDILEEALKLFLEIITQPSFPEDEFSHLKREKLYAIKTQDENPGHIAARTFNERIYAGHPYARQTIGTEESISALTLEDVRHYYQTYFVTSNMIIIAVGAVPRSELDAISHRISGAFPQGTPAGDAPSVQALKTAENISVAFPSDQAHVKIGQPFIEAGHPDFFALQLGNHILGGGGFGSRIMDEIRVKRGLAYSARSYFNTKRQEGVFAVGFQTRKDQVDMALDVARQILEDFVEHGPSQDEIKISLANIRGGFALNLGSNSAIMGTLGRIAVYGLGTDYLDTYLQNFDSLDAEAVHAAFKRNLFPDKLITVVVGGNG